MNVLSLFAGIGGLDLGLERAGMTVVGQVEIDPFCRAVLAHHWPEVPRHDDVRTTPRWWFSRPRPSVEVVVGGFPCQPVSLAGGARGTRDERWLWPAMCVVVRRLRPPWTVVENVPGLLGRGMGELLGDLASLGYDAEWDCVPAAALGAPHRRDRLFVVAHAHGGRRQRRAGHLGATGWPQPAYRRRPWPAESDVGRVAYGIPHRVDRLRALGNAVVPQVAEHVGRILMSRAEEDS